MAQTSSHGEHAAHGAPLNHEATDVPLTGTTRAALVTLVIIGVVMALMYGAWMFFESQARKSDPGAPPMADKDYGRRLPVLPRVQSTPATDLARFRAAQEGKLASYGWVDRASGVVHIPIERAIDLTAERAASIADPQAATAPAAPVTPPPAVVTPPVTPRPATAPPAPSGH
jgi:hypothetical protein